jgi:NADPH-dependent 2,4-dienoyl-CoA reductase/sulfur reductase-like enzyme
MLNTTAIEIKDKTLICINPSGVVNIHFGALVLAMGCRERTRANLMIPGSRPAGIYTAGTAQKLINVFGRNIGKEVVILGSGDIGMIMARRLSLGGAKVKAVIEIMPYLAGLVRNKLQCLDDFNIPLMLSHTVVDVSGVDRVESVTVAPVDEMRRPIMEKAEVIPCDTLLLSVGLIPENELTRSAEVTLSGITKGAVVNQYKQTDKPYIFACGNVLHVNDLVDHVSHESEDAGKFAALYAAGELKGAEQTAVEPGEGVRYVCPQKMAATEDNVDLYFRTAAPGRNTTLTISDDTGVLVTKKLSRTTPGTIEKLTLPGDLAKNIRGKIVVSAKHQEV